MESSFVKNLKSLRLEYGVSQAALAEVCGVTQQCVSEWERGKIEPTMSNLWRLADYFDVTIDGLVGRTAI